MRVVRIVREAGRGPRNYVFGRRLHHGVIGMALAAVGLVLSWHDRHDFRNWIRFAD